jgi:biotin-dependent carboxylase-like uncharacterized protein
MVSGVLDDYAATWANKLLGNQPNAAVLEATLLGPTMEALDPGIVSLAGADLGATVDGSPWQPGTVRRLTAGSRVQFSGRRRGARAYIGFAGGIDVPEVLGSRSTDLVAGFGGFQGRRLAAGDVLDYADGFVQSMEAPADTCLVRDSVRVLPGMRVDWFPQGTLQALAAQDYTVSAHSDRVGLRLRGMPLSGAPPRGDAVSEGMAIGSVQLPPEGEPVILLKSRGTIGGYATIAHVITADLPVVAQLMPGDGVRFEVVDLPEALDALRHLRALLGALV